MNFFAKKPTVREAAKSASKETKKEVRSNQRQIDRDIRDLDRQEKLLLQEIKSRAKSPGVNPATDKGLKSQAKQLVQIRKQKEKLYETKAQLNSVGMQATAMATQASAISAVGAVTEALGNANKIMDAKKMNKTLLEFQRENERANMKEELMNDALAEAFDESDVEEEADMVTNLVLAELGVELDSKMVGLDAPNKAPPKKVVEGEKISEEDAALMDALPDLRARLDAL
jgi:charged multivesicular body protein 2B